MLKVTDLKCGYDKRTEIVHGVSFTVEDGEFACIMGANGCGKSTTMKTVLDILPPFGGSVEMDGRDVFQMSAEERAQTFAYIPQSHTPPFPFTVADVVLLGRTPYIGQFAHVRERDRVAAYRAMRQLSITHLADSVYSELSGGQQQLVLIARALAQQPKVLLMDEPTASLDFGNQQLVLSRMRKLTQGGMSVLMVTHDPGHAFFCADKVVMMEKGSVLGIGTPEEIITEPNLKRIYGHDVCVGTVQLPGGGSQRVCVPMLV
ncbi:MAG: ABC transporter ATP-binding protein [Coriobacteriales bacterium]